MAGHEYAFVVLLVVEDALGDPAERFAGGDALADGCCWMPVPLAVSWKTWNVHAALQEEARLLRLSAGSLGEFLERVLETVIDLSEHAGTKFGGEHLARKLHGVVHHEIGGRIEHLHVTAGAAHAYDLRHQLLVAEKGIAHFVLRHCAGEGDGDHVAVDCDDFSCCVHGSLLKMKGEW